MTTMLRRVQQFLDSGDSDNAREEIDRAFGNLRRVDSHVREFADLLALGSIKASEIGLGVLGLFGYLLRQFYLAIVFPLIVHLESAYLFLPLLSIVGNYQFLRFLPLPSTLFLKLVLRTEPL
jgi:hypothetical protein